MDCMLTKIPVEGYVCALETTLYQEETQESIVPDACPDILTIVAAEGRARLTRKESLEGKLEVSGSVGVSVLYLPDGEEGVRSLELELPFRVSAAAPGLTAGCPAVVCPRVARAEARMLNPRKVLCRVELAVSCQGWVLSEETLCAPWAEAEPALQQRTQELERYVTVAAVEKSFAFTDQVELTGGHPPAAELLGHRLELRCAETKVVGSKLIFKGEATLQVRYRTADNCLAMGRWELPFSQIVEVGSIEEEGSCAMDLVVRESEVKLAEGGDGRTLDVHLELLAQAVIRQSRRTTVFIDAYSVTQDVHLEYESLRFAQLWEETVVTQTARELAETPTPAGRVEDCFAALGQPQLVREEGSTALAVQAWVTALYTGEDGVLSSVTGRMEVSVPVDLPQDVICKAKCALGGDPLATVTGAGIEIRLPVSFSYLATVEKECRGVAALQAEEREEALELPSVVLRVAQPGECLWDIAKAYSSTEKDILAANDLPDPEALEGKLLLIPRSR